MHANAPEGSASGALLPMVEFRASVQHDRLASSPGAKKMTRRISTKSGREKGLKRQKSAKSCKYLRHLSRKSFVINCLMFLDHSSGDLVFRLLSCKNFRKIIPQKGYEKTHPSNTIQVGHL
jgi:hypothetical protein